MTVMDEEIRKTFAVVPQEIGLRHRAYWIISEPDDEEQMYKVQTGDLCVKARDGGSNPIDPDACKHPNFRTTYQDGYDCTYRYYIYAPLTNEDIVQAAMADHDKHYWCLVRTLKGRKKDWAELMELLGEGSTVAQAIWDKYIKMETPRG